MDVVDKLKSIGDDTVAVLYLLADALRKAKQSKVAPSEDAAVLDSLNSVMERIKTFKAQVEECKQANNSFVKTRKDPLESIQLNYNELLSRIQADMEKIEVENEDIKRRLKQLQCWSTVNVEALLESAGCLALTTHAPPGWDQMAPIWPFRPPYPTEDLIRSSHLFSLMTGGVNIGTGDTDEAPTVSDLKSTGIKTATPTVHMIEEEEEENQEDLLRGLDIASL